MVTKLEGMLSYENSEAGYVEAETFADEWAGDNEAYAVVIEDFENDQLHVMDAADAEGFMAEWDSRVIYRADHRPLCSACTRPLHTIPEPECEQKEKHEPA